MNPYSNPEGDSPDGHTEGRWVDLMTEEEIPEGSPYWVTVFEGDDVLYEVGFDNGAWTEYHEAEPIR